MKTVRTRMMAAFLCLVMLCIAPAAMAEWTTLEVSFRGLTAQAGGQWRMENLSGSFAVWQDGRQVGVLTANGDTSNLVTVESDANVLLVPQMDTMPEGYLIQESGYSASVTAGRLNTAMVMVNSRPTIRNPENSFFFMPLKSPMAPSTGASTATSRLAKDTA